MAISTRTKTWLSLDDWAEIFGYNRWHFNGIELPSYAVGVGCGSVWSQEAEDPSLVSREELANAIHLAESNLSGWLGFNLTPDWNFEKHRVNEYPYFNNVNKFHKPRTLRLNRGHLISTGFRAVEEIDLALAIARVDKDGDGFAETGRITFSEEADADKLCGYKVFYPGKNADELWEIKNIQKTSTYIDIPMWALLKESNFYNSSDYPLNGEDNSIYIDEVDVYLIYNNPPSAVTLYYETDYVSDGKELAYTCNGRVHDNELGTVAYNPTRAAEPNIVGVSYYSGWTEQKLNSCFNLLADRWKRPVAYLATSYLTTDPCRCCNDTGDIRVSKWSETLDQSVSDRSASGVNVSNFTTIKTLENIFGIATRGAWFAYQMTRLERIV